MTTKAEEIAEKFARKISPHWVMLTDDKILLIEALEKYGDEKLEEAAKVAEKSGEKNPIASKHTARLIAVAIRALKGGVK